MMSSSNARRSLHRPEQDRHANGSSQPPALARHIPEIDTSDLSTLPIVRLEPTEEMAIAGLAAASAEARAEADVLERQFAAGAAAIVDGFTAHR